MKSIAVYGLAVVAGLAFASPTFAVDAPKAPKPDKPAGAKLAQADCEKAWNEALAGSPAPLAKDKAKPYVVEFAKVDTDKDEKVTQAEWTAGCEGGWIRATADPSKVETKAPSK